MKTTRSKTALLGGLLAMMAGPALSLAQTSSASKDLLKDLSLRNGNKSVKTTTVDVSSSSKSIPFTWRLDDDNNPNNKGPVAQYFSVSFLHEKPRGVGEINVDYHSKAAESGRGSITVPRFTYPGNWSISSIYLYSSDNKSVSYSRNPYGDQRPLPRFAKDLVVRVVNTKMDTQAPSIESFVVNGKNARLSQNGEIYIPFTATVKNPGGSSFPGPYSAVKFTRSDLSRNIEHTVPGGLLRGYFYGSSLFSVGGRDS